MLSSLSLILGPVLSILDKIFGYVSNVETTKLQTEAQVETASIQGMASVERQWWFVSACIAAFALIFIPYDFKAVVWDNVWMNGHASTPALKGDLAWVHLTVVGGLFLHGLTK